MLSGFRSTGVLCFFHGDFGVRTENMNHCHLCGQPLPHHADECRAHRDLAMFDRVYRRLREQERNPLLQASLVRHLIRHGRLEAEQAA